MSQSLGTGAGGTTGPQPNNSYAIVDTGYSNINSYTRVSIYCCSNSSYSTGSITLPNSAVTTRNYGNYIKMSRFRGSYYANLYAGCMKLFHYSRVNYYSSSSSIYYTLSSSYRGIYTCNILDSNNVNIPLSFGIYGEGSRKCIPNIF